MTATQVKDKDGHTIDLINVRGLMFPKFPAEALENACQFKARPGDVLLCSAPKSGSHWMNEILRFLMAGTTDLPIEEKTKGMIDMNLPSVLEALPSPRLLNSHMRFDDISPEFFKHKCKIVHITRNPRDSAISYFKHTKTLSHYYHYDGDWDGYFHLFLEGKADYGSWFEYTKGWEKGMNEQPNHPFLVLSYEAMKKDPVNEIRKMAEFLEVPHTEDFLKEIAHKTDFNVMKESRFRDTPGEFAVIYRKGQVGDWKNAFTKEQQELFDEVFDREMVGTNAYKLYSPSSQS